MEGLKYTEKKIESVVEEPVVKKSKLKIPWKQQRKKQE